LDALGEGAFFRAFEGAVKAVEHGNDSTRETESSEFHQVQLLGRCAPTDVRDVRISVGDFGLGLLCARKRFSELIFDRRLGFFDDFFVTHQGRGKADHS
jgi:hypothetical protein